MSEEKTEDTAAVPAVAETKELAPGALFGVKPSTFDEAWRFAQMIATSGLAPKGFANKPKDCMVAMQMGLELGLAPMQALQNIAVINGRPSLWGDALVGLCLAHPSCEWIRENFDLEKMTAICTVKRKGYPEHMATFSEEDAQMASLWGKAGPWTQYPKRMLQNRARAFALRDRFADVLRGINMAEEVRDIVVLDGEWSPGTEAPPAQLDSAKQITEGLSGGKQDQPASGNAGSPADTQDASGPRMKPDETTSPSSASESVAGAAPSEPKPRGRPTNFEKFKTEIAEAEDVKEHWQDKRQLYQSKLDSDDYKALATYAEGLAFEQAHPKG